jgi:hypothetical protein
MFYYNQIFNIKTEKYTYSANLAKLLNIRLDFPGRTVEFFHIHLKHSAKIRIWLERIFSGTIQ